jgi:4-carboxymuconolactone decarboxylase
MSDERYERGKAIARSVLGRTTEWNIDELAKLSPMHGRAIYEYCYGTVWAEPNLPIKIKEFILIAVCAAQGEYEAVERQIRGAINMGATREEIVEAITTCAPYIGYPRTNASLRVAQSVFDRWEEMKDEWRSAS